MQNSFLQWFASRFLDRQLLPHELMRVRKVVYIVLIVVLFTASFFWRRSMVETRATELAVQEQSHGEVELSGAFIRRGLSGMRGIATSFLWYEAIDAQMKHKFPEMEFYVQATAKLQPHFVTPWLFQGWNLSYNVSVEMDRPFDKYYYIARGMLLLGEGERRNRHYPDMRRAVGFTVQHKIATSDETNVLRSIFQLSMIPPNKRQPARFYTIDNNGETVFNWIEFEKFCKENPKLIRRLREGLRRENKLDQRRQFTCERREELIQFLRDNWRVPSLYEEVAVLDEGATWQEKNDRLLPPQERFPLLPPPPYTADRPIPAPQRLFEPGPGISELTWDSELNDDIDAYLVARAWYCYAQEPLPDPSDLPGISKEPEHRLYHRNPTFTTLLFRTQPCLAQAQHAKSLQQEGWYDTTPYQIRDWFSERSNRFEDGSPAQLAVSKSQSSVQAWEHAFAIWAKHADDNHLRFESPTDEINRIRTAQQYWDKYGIAPYASPHVAAGEEDSLPPEDREPARAARFLYEYDTYRRVSNFPHHYHFAEVERQENTITARRLFHEAETYRLLASWEKALQTYEDPRALDAWREDILAWRERNTNQKYRDDHYVQEGTLEIQLNYTSLRDEWRGKPVKSELAGLVTWISQGSLGQLTQSGGGFLLVNPYLATQWVQRPDPLPGLRFQQAPFDRIVYDFDQNTQTQFASFMMATAGSPVLPTPLVNANSILQGCRSLISEHVVTTVLTRKGLLALPAQPEQPETEGESED